MALITFNITIKYNAIVSFSLPLFTPIGTQLQTFTAQKV